MTNKEIKLELAKVALTKCNFTTSETLTESIKNLYEWIIEEQDDTKKDYDTISVSEILRCVKKNSYDGSPIFQKLSNVFSKSDINTIGDLLKIGRRRFKKFRSVGAKAMFALDEALEELNITGW